MKLLLVLEDWGTGGTEQYVQTVFQQLAEWEPSWKIDLALFGKQEPGPDPRDEDWVNQVTRLDGSAAKLRKLVRQTRPRVVHLHLYTSTLKAAVATKSDLSNNTQLLTTFHSPLSQWNWRHRMAFRIAVSMSDGVIGASDFTAGQLRTWRPDVVSASPPLSRATLDVPTDLREIDADRPFTIVGCGRLSREKDWSTLLKAFSDCRSSSESVCQLIGSGQADQALKNEAQALGCSSRVQFAGRLNHEEALRRIAGADLFVLPSRFEGFGIAAVEAMSLGTPTITSNFPASAEYIEPGETADQFPIGDSTSLARLIDWHAEHRSASRAMGENGRRSVLDRYSADRCASLHRALYIEQAKH